MLLNELQKQQREMQKQEQRSHEQLRTIETLLESNAVLAARLDALESGPLASR